MKQRLALAIPVAALLLAACTSNAANPTSSSSGHMHDMGNGQMMSGSAMPMASASDGSQETTITEAAVTAGALPELRSQNGQLAVTLTAAESQVPYQGTTRWAMTYNGLVSGPTLRVHPGDSLSVTVVNNLDKPTSLHTHGLHVSPDQDNPFIMIEPGQSYTYTYDIPKDQQAGTYWYHPHMHGITAEQVASGLSGAILVEDDTDAALSQVSTDRVLVVNDPPLTQENPWATGAANASGSHDMQGMDMGGMDGMHSMDGMSGDGMMMGQNGSGVDMMTAMMGRTGPRLLTNGLDGVTLADSGGKLERAHVVNATASTRLLLTFSGSQLLQLSTDGGRLPAAKAVDSIELAPGQRTEVVLVPGADGGQLTAQRLSNEGNGGATGLPEVLATVAPDAGADTAALPASFTANTRDLFAPNVKVAKQRVITLDGHMNPTIDGKPFDPNTVNFTAKKGTVEEWVIKSNSPMIHPIHLHTWPFQIKGEQGWHDIVTVGPYQEQVIRVAYDDFAGKTVIHCHVLDHEDTGMMAIIAVE